MLKNSKYFNISNINNIKLCKVLPVKIVIISNNLNSYLNYQHEMIYIVKTIYLVISGSALAPD